MTKENAKRLYDHYVAVQNGKLINQSINGPAPANDKQKAHAKKNAADILLRHPELKRKKTEPKVEEPKVEEPKTDSKK